MEDDLSSVDRYCHAFANLAGSFGDLDRLYVDLNNTLYADSQRSTLDHKSTLSNQSFLPGKNDTNMGSASIDLLLALVR